MKKSIIALMALATLFASCAKESELTPAKPEQQQQLYTLHAKVSEATKVSADNAGTFAWQAGDVISVLNNSNEPVDFTTPDGGAEVNFHGTVAAENLGSYAFYPANDNHTNTVFALGPELDWSANASNMPMVGPIVSETATFTAVGAVIKLICFNVPDDARLLQVTSLSKKIAGTFAFSGSPMAIATVNSGTASEKTLTINFTADDIADCNGNMVFYVPVPSGELGKLTFALKATADGSALFSQQTKASITVAKNSIVSPPVLNCSTGILMWSETFKGYDSNDWTTEATINTTTLTYEAFAYGGASIKYKSGEAATKVYTDGPYAGGASPELLVNKSNGTFTVNSIPTTGAKKLILSFLSNRTTFTITPSGDATASLVSNTDGVMKYNISNPSALSSINLEIKNTGGSNARVDNIEVRAAESYTAPAITPADNALTIAVAAGDENSASTTFTYTNPLDDMPLVAIASEDWITPTITGSGPYTLTVTAAKKVTTGSRAGTVTLRASGVSKSIAVTQPSALVPKPGVLVTPGDGTFTATWTKDANATAYAVYLGDPADEANNITAEAELAGSTYTLTKAVANGDYDLYVKVSTVTANYVAEEGFTHEAFTCSDATPTYTITINQPATGGTITAKGQSASATAEEDEVVTLVATPATGYKFSAWSVTKTVGGATVTVTSNSFVMPAEPVTVTATFVAKEWVLVTDASTLATNDQIVIAVYTDSYKKVAGGVSSNLLTCKSATFNTDGSKITTLPNDALILTLNASSTSWELKNGNDYLKMNGDKKVAISSGSYTWTISIASYNATISGTYTVSNKVNTYKLQYNYNSGNDRFTGYTSPQTLPRIYRYE